MNKKKAMKAIAAAGIAIGGVSVFQDVDLVYANELEIDALGAQGEIEVDLNNISSQAPVINQDETSTADSSVAVPENEEGSASVPESGEDRKSVV